MGDVGDGSDEYWKDIEEILLVNKGNDEPEDTLDQMKQQSDAALMIVNAFK